MKKQPTSKETAGKKAAAGKKSKTVITGVRLRVPAPEPIQIKHLAQLTKYVRPKRVHPCRTLPLVREGLEREFHSMTRQVAFHRALPVLMPMAATDDLALVTNTELTSPTTQQRASNVGEPSAAMNDQVVFYTGNWYAAMSSNGGKTFSFIDLATAFPNADPASSNFCCDQVVQYISKIDIFVWLMQYGPATGDNIQRLAFASTTDVVQGRWRLFDITTHILNVNGAFDKCFWECQPGGFSGYPYSVLGHSERNGHCAAFKFSRFRNCKVGAQANAFHLDFSPLNETPLHKRKITRSIARR